MTRDIVSTVENVFSDGQSTGSGFEPVTRKNALFKDSLPDRTQSPLPCAMNLLSCDSPGSFSPSRPVTISMLTHLTNVGAGLVNEWQRRDRHDKKHHLDR